MTINHDATRSGRALQRAARAAAKANGTSYSAELWKLRNSSAPAPPDPTGTTGHPYSWYDWDPEPAVKVAERAALGFNGADLGVSHDGGGTSNRSDVHLDVRLPAGMENTEVETWTVDQDFVDAQRVDEYEGGTEQWAVTVEVDIVVRGYLAHHLAVDVPGLEFLEIDVDPGFDSVAVAHRVSVTFDVTTTSESVDNIEILGTQVID